MNISVVIPAYNSRLTILQALDSVYSQIVKSYVKFEVIVVNDGSTDDTLNLLDNYIAKNLVENLYVYTKLNSGVSSARNLGISVASGEWIAFLDSDDIWLPNKIQLQIDVIETVPDVNFIGCARNNERLSILGRKVDLLYNASVDDLLLKMFPQTSTALVRKELLNQVGGYNEKMTHSEDGELWIRLCRFGGFYYMPESLVFTGNGKGNYGVSGLSANLKKMQEGSLNILDICYMNGTIPSWLKYQTFRLFYILKYWRRLFAIKVKTKCFLK